MTFGRGGDPRRRAPAVLEIVTLRLEARRRRERLMWRQERVDDEGCGAVMVLLRLAWDDWE